MAWFGSLQLAYKYAIVLGSLFAIVIIAGFIKVYFSKRRLKKYTKKIEEDALGAGEERVELNKRELDEGDLFGIRAIQSGYFGGVAQSRPSSIAEDRSDRDSTASNTLLGSHQSPERKAPSPMSSVVTLPLEARTASPLRHTVLSAADPDRPRTSKKQGPHPIKSTLQPSDVQMNGGLNHDPAVNMFLNVPPSPGATSRPSSGFEFSTQSPVEGSLEPNQTLERNSESAPVRRNSQYGGHYIPTAAPEVPVTGGNRSSARPVFTAQYREHEPPSQHASVVREDSDATIRDNNRWLRSTSIQEEHGFTTRPVKPATRSSIQEEDDFTTMPTPRSVSSYRPYATRTSTYDYQSPNPSGPSPPRDHEVPAVPHPRNQQPISDIERSSTNFHETDQTALDFDNTTRNHISRLSDASSIYSTAHRYSFFPEPLGIRNHPQPSSPQTAMNPLPRHPYEIPTIVASFTTTKHSGTSRASDTSSHQPPSLNTPSANNSHRNTREFRDFYDSYWRYNGQSTVGSGNAVGLKEGTRAEARIKEGRKQDRLEIAVPTITEVETPIGSPALTGGRGAGVGVAM